MTPRALLNLIDLSFGEFKLSCFLGIILQSGSSSAVGVVQAVASFFWKIVLASLFLAAFFLQD